MPLPPDGASGLADRSAYTARTVRRRTHRLGTSYGYHVFISHARKPDAALADELRRRLPGMATRWWERRQMRVFVDTASMLPHDSLRAQIREVLDDTAALTLLACPESAGSRWVREEVAHWLGGEPRRPLAIVLTGGDIVWDEVAGDFDWGLTTALDRDVFGGRFSEEPARVNLRAADQPRTRKGRRALLAHTAIVIAAAPCTAGNGRTPDDRTVAGLRAPRAAGTWPSCSGDWSIT
jgi:hypothetical protein